MTFHREFAADDWQDSVDTSEVHDVSALKEIVVMLAGDMTDGDVSVEISWDGTYWAPWETLTATGVFATIPCAKYMRVSTLDATDIDAVVGYSAKVA